jgi:hypothetical protein
LHDRAIHAVRWDIVPEGQLLVSSPTTWFNQGPLAGNPYEEHRSLWGIDEMRSLGFEIIHHCERFFLASMRR